MKQIFIYLLLLTSPIFAQNKIELLLLQHDEKINLAPMYGAGVVEKTVKQKITDSIFIDEVLKLCGTYDSACKAQNNLAWGYFYDGKIRTAMKRFNQAWLLDSTNASEYFGFSCILEVIKENPNEFFETSPIKIKTVNNPKEYYKIGKQKDKDNKNEILSLYYICTGFETYGKIDLAIESSNRLLELVPKDTFALKQRGHLYIIKENWGKAILDLNSAIQNGAKSADLFNDLGYSYQESGDYENAFKFYEKASQINSTYLHPINNYCLLKLKLGNYDEALEYIEKCISIKPDFGQFYRTKGEILIKLNKKEEGLKCLKKAKKLGDEKAGRILRENK